MAEALSQKLAPMRCRACQRQIRPNRALAASLGKRLTVHSRDDCIYRCVCGVAYSNANEEAERVLITAGPARNVPKPVRSGLAEALSQSLNRRNRRNKELKFCFENSEEAVTWTVIRGLERQGRLDALVAPRQPAGAPALLLWGAPIAGERAPEIVSALTEICRSLGEAPDSLSEPDAVVVWDDLALVVVAKFLSENEQRPNHSNFNRYLDRRGLYEATPAEVAAAGYFELTRFWRIGAALADALHVPRFLLVNLGPPEKIEADAIAFSNLLSTSPAREFWYLSWSDVLEAAAPLEPWLDRYASERHRLLYWR